LNLIEKRVWPNYKTTKILLVVTYNIGLMDDCKLILKECHAMLTEIRDNKGFWPKIFGIFRRELPGDFGEWLQLEEKFLKKYELCLYGILKNRTVNFGKGLAKVFSVENYNDKSFEKWRLYKDEPGVSDEFIAGEIEKIEADADPNFTVIDGNEGGSCAKLF
jgi:hypothetical protein